MYQNVYHVCFCLFPFHPPTRWMDEVPRIEDNGEWTPACHPPTIQASTATFARRSRAAEVDDGWWKSLPNETVLFDMPRGRRRNQLLLTHGPLLHPRVCPFGGYNELRIRRVVGEERSWENSSLKLSRGRIPFRTTVRVRDQHTAGISFLSFTPLSEDSSYKVN